jgi:hypothetical protein
MKQQRKPKLYILTNIHDNMGTFINVFHWMYGEYRLIKFCDVDTHRWYNELEGDADDYLKRRTLDKYIEIAEVGNGTTQVLTEAEMILEML